MSIPQIKQIEILKEKRKAFQEKEEQIKAGLVSNLSKHLVNAHALDVDFEILIGGMIDVIDKTKQRDIITEAWKLSGQKFCQRQKKKKLSTNPSASKKVKENKSHGE